MTILNRLKYAWFVTVAFIGLAMLICMIALPRFAEVVFSSVFVVPVFVIVLLLAPLMQKHLRFK